MTESDAAYLAGVFDSEGSVYVNGEGTLRVQVANSERTLCEAFLAFGGSVHVSTPAGTRRRSYTTRRTVWQWVGHRTSATQMQATLGRFLRLKPLDGLLSRRRDD